MCLQLIFSFNFLIIIKIIQRRNRSSLSVSQCLCLVILTLSWNCQFLVESYLNPLLYISVYNDFVKHSKNNNNKYIYSSKRSNSHAQIWIVPFFGQGHLFTSVELRKQIAPQNYQCTLIVTSQVPITIVTHYSLRQGTQIKECLG